MILDLKQALERLKDERDEPSSSIDRPSQQDRRVGDEHSGE